MFKSKDTVSVGKYNVQIVSKIGEGGHATIYLVRDTNTGEEMVLKKSTPAVQAQMDMAQREVALNRQLKHANVVEFRGDSITEYRRNGKKVYDVYMLMEYCPGGHLLDSINKMRKMGSPLNEAEILKYFVQVCRAVDYLHRHKPPVAHRDIKLENVLLARGGVVKLCDFGSCSTDIVVCKTKEDRIKQEGIIDKFTTPFYRAPELCDLFRGDEISHKVDIWALGCMIYAMAFGKHAFEDGGKLGILNGKYQIPKGHGYSDDFISIIRWTLNPNPKRRPAIGDVLDYVEELIGTTIAHNAKRRGSGTGERPSAELLASLTEQVAGIGVDESSRSRRSNRSSSRSSQQSETKPAVETPVRNRAPSAALRARMARRTSSVNSNNSLPSPVSAGGLAPPPQDSPSAKSASSTFNPFDVPSGEASLQGGAPATTQSGDTPVSNAAGNQLPLNLATQPAASPALLDPFAAAAPLIPAMSQTGLSALAPSLHSAPIQQQKQMIGVQSAMPVYQQQMGTAPMHHHQQMGTMPVQQQTIGVMPVQQQTMGVMPVQQQQTLGVMPVQQQTMGVMPAQQQTMGVMPVQQQQTMGIMPAQQQQMPSTMATQQFGVNPSMVPVQQQLNPMPDMNNMMNSPFNTQPFCPPAFATQNSERTNSVETRSRASSTASNPFDDLAPSDLSKPGKPNPQAIPLSYTANPPGNQPTILSSTTF